jgi:glycosyltransferase involved in cell wall biosynthesis
MNIRKATTNDVDTIVKIHCDAFKGFFLTSLGSQFLKFYYSCFIKSSESVTMVAEEDGAIFVLPTYTEGFPNVILECMASGCPIITTPVGAIPDMLQFGSTQACGACVDVKDVQGLKNNY